MFYNTNNLDFNWTYFSTLLMKTQHKSIMSKSWARIRQKKGENVNKGRFYDLLDSNYHSLRVTFHDFAN